MPRLAWRIPPPRGDIAATFDEAADQAEAVRIARSDPVVALMCVEVHPFKVVIDRPAGA